VYRAVSETSWAVMSELKDCGLMSELSSGGMIVHTDLIPPGSDLHSTLVVACPPFNRFLRHERVPFISYPYEWSAGMVADAAVLQLELQSKLLLTGFSLKDASIYNTQFINGRPVFIDLPSIEKAPRLDLWVAYGQFCRHFLFPLILKYFQMIDFRGYFLSNLDGLDVESVYRALGWTRRLRPMLFVDVFLQRQFQTSGQRNVETTRKRVGPGSGSGRMASNAFVQIANLDRLIRKIKRLKMKTDFSGNWIDYAESNSYSESAETIKKQLVADFLKAQRPKRLLDLGCNTGTYSLMAHQAGAQVVAVDADEACVDKFYRKVHAQSLNIQPLCMDCASPSPGIGFMNQERKPFLNRAEFDAVLALAVLHHLLITSRIPLEATSIMFSKLTSRWLIMEFVGREDVMFKHLLALREDIYKDVTREHFETVYSRLFHIHEKHEIPDTDRVLYICERK
jgi:SAM-dependent methyltransferase